MEGNLTQKDSPTMAIAAALAIRALANKRPVAVLVGKVAALLLRDELGAQCRIETTANGCAVPLFMGIPIYVVHWLPVTEIRVLESWDLEIANPNTEPSPSP